VSFDAAHFFAFVSFGRALHYLTYMIQVHFKHGIEAFRLTTAIIITSSNSSAGSQTVMEFYYDAELFAVH